MKEYLRGQEIKRRIVNVDQAMSVALDAIDRAADNVRRGRKPELNKLAMDFMAYQTTYDESVLSQYFQTLSEQSEAAAPAETDKLEVPSAVLNKQLPHLKGDKYTGASHRVWKKLTRKFGRKRRSGGAPGSGGG